MWDHESIQSGQTLQGLWDSFVSKNVAAGSAVCERPPVHEEPQASPSGSRSGALVDQILSNGRYALLLRPQIAESLDREHCELARQAFFDGMSEVPAGTVRVSPWVTTSDGKPAPEVPARELQVERMFLDKFPVTNQQFQQFVDFGGYQQASLWHADVWPRVSEFVDSTGAQGPRYWERGRFPKGLAEHPVVGVCWFEADAFARWAGKRLPQDAEWVKAASWPVSPVGGRPIQRRYPWGETHDNTLVNLWSSGKGTTVPVTEYPEGVSVGGVQQMIGNVWEWTSSLFEPWIDGQQGDLELTLMSIRGASFATYFDSDADSQAQSADSPLARKSNIGIRCAISACDVEEAIGLSDGHSDWSVLDEFAS